MKFISGLVVLALSTLAAHAEDRGASKADGGHHVAPRNAQSALSGSDVLWPEFQKLDRNGDGFIDREEIRSYPRAREGQFEAADLDRNGRLDYAEFKVLFANTSEDRRLGSK
jgi:hypothetical protein